MEYNYEKPYWVGLVKRPPIYYSCFTKKKEVPKILQSRGPGPTAHLPHH